MILPILNDRSDPTKDPWKIQIVLGRWDQKIIGFKSSF